MRQKPLSPYVGGALAGLLMVLTAAISAKYFGASTSFVRTAGMIENIFIPSHVLENQYFQTKIPHIDWQWMFLVGIFLGSFIMSVLTRTFKWQQVPDMWKERFGTHIIKRAVVAFVGGFILIYGARLAGGCPSGHGLAGVMQLAPSGFLSAVCFFIGGIFTAKFVYGKGGRSD